MNRPIQALLVDDHRLVAEAMERILVQEGIVVCGVIGSVAEVGEVETKPDVVLMDYMLGDGTGVEATRIAKARWPRARVVMLTAVDADETVAQAVQAGADGYLTKNRALDEVVSAVRSAVRGEVLLPPGILSRIAQRLVDEPPEPPLSQPLTGRELEVLRQLAAGTPSRVIARNLRMSPETVRTHAQAIRRKLGARSRLEAVVIALRRGLIEPAVSA